MSFLQRRGFLRGCGAMLALPGLEGFALATRPARRRLVFVYVPNGIFMPDWHLGEAGPLSTLPATLQPLASLSTEIQILSGLTHDKARANGDGPGDHARASAAFLTGAQPYKSPGDRIYVGESADQVAARTIGGETRLRSLEIGCEGGRRSGQCDSGYACVYSSSIAWANATTPLSKETRPRAVFDRLFRPPSSGTPAERARRQSVLDLVREDARALRAKLGVGDQQRVDEYLSCVREIERRIERSETATDATEEIAGDQRPEARPADYGEHIRLFNELIVLALAADATRVITFMHADEGSNRSYPFLEIPEGHHTLSHHGSDAAKIEKIRRINHWHSVQLAHLLQRLHETPDIAVDTGESRSLLDASMVVYGSGISDGNRHDHADLPILLAGRGGGSLHPGVHRLYPEETPATNLYLSLLERMGASVENLGDSTGRLSEL